MGERLLFKRTSMSCYENVKFVIIGLLVFILVLCALPFLLAFVIFLGLFRVISCGGNPAWANKIFCNTINCFIGFRYFMRHILPNIWGFEGLITYDKMLLKDEKKLEKFENKKSSLSSEEEEKQSPRRSNETVLEEDKGEASSVGDL